MLVILPFWSIWGVPISDAILSSRILQLTSPLSVEFISNNENICDEALAVISSVWSPASSRLILMVCVLSCTGLLPTTTGYALFIFVWSPSWYLLLLPHTYTPPLFASAAIACVLYAPDSRSIMFDSISVEPLLLFTSRGSLIFGPVVPLPVWPTLL